ncbi:MAG: PAS domain-containing protein, partial [Gammaproteobacteria bacterium]|nr:PAS domain-containing protein [Gammaproteobacteria bacterium]
AVGFYSMSNLTLINRHLNIISGDYQTKIFLTATMRRAAGQRTVNLLHMIVLDDPFEQDSEWIKFNSNGAEFANARLTLLEMSFDNIEQSLLNRQRRITQQNSEIQKQVAELALNNKKDEATKLLRSKAIPLQTQVFKILNDLYYHYENTLKLKKRDSEHSYRRISIINWIIGSIALIIGIFISVLTVRNVSKTRARLIKNQQQLQLSQQQLEMALEATSDGLWDWDISNNTIYYSPQWLRMLEYTNTDIDNNFFFWEQLIHPDDKERINQCLRDNLDAKKDSYSNEYRIRKANGDWLWIMDRGKVTLRDDNNRPLRAVGIHTDISQRKQMENDLENKQRFVNAVLNDLQTSIAILDNKGIITFINDSPLNDIGLNEDLIGQQFSDCPLWSSNTTTQKQVEKQIQDACNGISSIDDIKIHSTWGNIWINIAIHPVFDKQGSVEYLIPEIRDITDRIDAEEALRRSQKMEAIGQLSGGIAHDFNNQLGIVIGYLDMLSDYRNNPPETITKWLNSAYSASLRCIDLTRQLLTFSRHQSTDQTLTNINESIDNMNTLISRSVTPEINVQYLLADHLWDTVLNQGELQDAILNLIINARDAMPDGGQLSIQSKNIHLDTGHSSYEPHIKVGDYIELIVSDSGSGISKQDLEHIFEPFFSTKPAGQGTGLGLAMIYAFVKRSKGYINVISDKNKGTAFHLYFPRETDNISTKISTTQQEELPVGTETILIVDDEPELTRLASRYLKGLGYKILEAIDSASAIQILETHKDIDLIFSDIVMPGEVNGYQLVTIAQELQPGIKALLTSGFNEHTRNVDKIKQLNNTLLAKPYFKADLAKAIRNALDN